MYILFSKFENKKQHTILVTKNYETLILKFEDYKIKNNINTDVKLINFQNSESENVISFSLYNIDNNFYYKHLPNQKLTHLYLLEIIEESCYHKTIDIHFSSTIDDLLKIIEKIFHKKDNVNVEDIKRQLIQNNYISTIMGNYSYKHNCYISLLYFTPLYI